MDVSAEAADLVVKEGIQATESAVKLAGTGLKNVAALLLALSKEDYKVVGKTNAKRLARETSPPLVIPLKQEDVNAFGKLAKEYGVLYFIAQKKGNESGHVNIVSTQAHAAQLNVIMEALHYPIPQKGQEETEPKKARPRAPQERSSPERGSGLTTSETMEATEPDRKPSVKKRLEGLKRASEQHTKEQTIGPKTRSR